MRARLANADFNTLTLGMVLDELRATFGIKLKGARKDWIKGIMRSAATMRDGVVLPAAAPTDPQAVPAIPPLGPEPVAAEAMASDDSEDDEPEPVQRAPAPAAAAPAAGSLGDLPAAPPLFSSTSAPIEGYLKESLNVFQSLVAAQRPSARASLAPEVDVFARKLLEVIKVDPSFEGPPGAEIALRLEVALDAHDVDFSLKTKLSRLFKEYGDQDPENMGASDELGNYAKILIARSLI